MLRVHCKEATGSEHEIGDTNCVLIARFERLASGGARLRKQFESTQKTDIPQAPKRSGRQK